MTKICKHCGQEHPLQYLHATNGAIHLIYRCSNKKGSPTVFLPRIEGLNLPTTLSKKQLKKVVQPNTLF